jgi:hypothetical protein
MAAQARLDARGVRDTETIAFQLARIHRHGVYDLQVHNGTAPADQLARQLLRHAGKRVPMALRQLAGLLFPDSLARHEAL